jgi:hypothetical protein
MADSFDLQSKIPRAFRAWVVAQGVAPANSTYAEFAADTSVDRVLPNTTFSVDDAGLRDGSGPGNYRFTVTATFRDPAAVQPNQLATQPLTDAVQRFSDIMGQLLLSDDETTLDYTRRQINTAGRSLAVDASQGTNPAQVAAALANADMANFTILHLWEGSLGSHQKVEHEGGLYYERVATFDCLACNASID